MWCKHIAAHCTETQLTEAAFEVAGVEIEDIDAMVEGVGDVEFLLEAVDIGARWVGQYTFGRASVAHDLGGIGRCSRIKVLDLVVAGTGDNIAAIGVLDDLVRPQQLAVTGADRLDILHI